MTTKAKHTAKLLRCATNPSGSFRISTDDKANRTICHHIPHMSPSTSATFEESTANGERLAVCWNACAGIPTEQLETGSVATLIAECPKLWDIGYPLDEAVRKVRDALAPFQKDKSNA